MYAVSSAGSSINRLSVFYLMFLCWECLCCDSYQWEFQLSCFHNFVSCHITSVLMFDERRVPMVQFSPSYSLSPNFLSVNIYIWVLLEIFIGKFPEVSSVFCNWKKYFSRKGFISCSRLFWFSLVTSVNLFDTDVFYCV